MLTFRFVSSGPEARCIQLTREAFETIFVRDIPYNPAFVEFFENGRSLDPSEKIEVLEDRTLNGRPLFE